MDRAEGNIWSLLWLFPRGGTPFRAILLLLDLPPHSSVLPKGGGETYLMGEFRESEWRSTQLFLPLSVSDLPVHKSHVFFALFLHALNFPESDLRREDYGFPTLPAT